VIKIIKKASFVKNVINFITHSKNKKNTNTNKNKNTTTILKYSIIILYPLL
jgi:hypothetical protein